MAVRQTYTPPAVGGQITGLTSLITASDIYNSISSVVMPGLGANTILVPFVNSISIAPSGTIVGANAGGVSLVGNTLQIVAVANSIYNIKAHVMLGHDTGGNLGVQLVEDNASVVVEFDNDSGNLGGPNPASVFFDHIVTFLTAGTRNYSLRVNSTDAGNALIQKVSFGALKLG